MFIDYVTLQLVNMAAGLVILALYVGWGLDGDRRDRWPAAFAMVGLIAMVTGFHMIFTWPLPSIYNVTHGELSVLFGTVFLGAALAIGRGWNLMMVAMYGFFAGLAAVVVGVNVIDLKLTLTPVFSGTGYILTGLAGVLAVPTLYLRRNWFWRTGAVVVLLIAAAIWALTGYGAYRMHLVNFKAYQPELMRQTATQPAK